MNAACCSLYNIYNLYYLSRVPWCRPITVRAVAQWCRPIRSQVKSIVFDISFGVHEQICRMSNNL